MTTGFSEPAATGQLVWCPGDPSLGIGVVTELARGRIRVRFLRLQEERAYTTRGADGVIVRYEIGAGEKVRFGDREHVRVVRCVDPEADLAVYELEDGSEVTESELVPEIRAVGAKARLSSLTLVHPEVVRARIQGLSLAASWPRTGIAGILGARAYWLPHQIDVATRAIESDRVRMLLADEVGLGKTVEAILIYAGLRHEGRANRVLILTPSALCIQWLGELYRKAHELFVLLDEDRIADAGLENPDLSPFEAHQRIVASIDAVARDPELAAAAAAAAWDLVIVDEAHHLRWSAKGRGNAEYRLLEGIAPAAQHLLLLTATPMALDPAEYHALLRLLEPSRFDDPRSFESIRERVDTIRTVSRELEAAVKEGTAFPKEHREAVTAVLDDDPDDAKRWRNFVKLKASSPKRREAADEILDALRSRHGLADYVVRNRRGPVGGLPQRHAQVHVLEPTELQAKLIDVGESVMFDLVETITDPGQRYRSFGSLLRALWAAPRALVDILRPLSPALVEHLLPYVGKVVGAPLDGDGLPTGDARLRWLVRLLRRDRDDKLLVFVETDIAVRALRDSLESLLGGKIAIFHKDLAPRDQDRQVAWFRDPDGPQVMLSTEAGGEGRNFQFCNRVVLYDLPWRPATVEQRIGRVDRVGQRRDVHVLVPCFKSGYEAAVLKVMQESIGVLDQTVGGIDHALEYVSDRLAELILSGGGAEAWKALYLETSGLVTEARERIARSVDPILDHASFSPQRVDALMSRIPRDLEDRTERFVRGYADHSKLDIHTKAGPVVAVEGAPGAAGRYDFDTAYAATFSRTHGIDHEDVEFLSFGHPLVEQALEWAQEADDASAALAIARGYPRDGAVFLWRYGLDIPDDVPEAAAYFEAASTTFALDEAGDRVLELEGLLDDTPALDRMDAAPLRGALDRWRRLVETNHAAAEALAEARTEAARAAALERLEISVTGTRRHLERQRNRRRAEIPPDSAAAAALDEQHDAALAALDVDERRVANAIANARPKLIAAVAVRLLKAKAVSA